MFTMENFAAFAIMGILGIGIPVAAVVIFKLKNKDVWFPSALIGAATFIVFALVLEQILHTFMLPIVTGNNVLYVLYGALAAGTFEETGRFVSYKLLMKKHYTTKNAVMFGLGHGGFECLFIMGVTAISYAAFGLGVNAAGGVEGFIAYGGGVPEGSVELVRQQLDAMRQIGIDNAFLSIFERVLAMTIHICMSVVVYFGASRKGHAWLYPLALFLHAFIDSFAALHQIGVISSIYVMYAILVVLVAALVIFAVKLVKHFREKDRLAAPEIS